MAHEFGLSWTAMMGWPGPPLEIHLRVLTRWLDELEKTPSKRDWYDARIVQAVEVGQLRNPSRELKDRLLKFRDPKDVREEKLPPGIKRLTKEDIVALRSAAVKTRAGVGLNDPESGRTVQPTVIKADGTVVGPNYADRPVTGRGDVVTKVGKEEGT